MIEGVRFGGLAIALAIAAYGVVKYRYFGGWRRFDLLLALAISAAVAVVSVTPGVGDVFLRVFDLQNRAFALLVASNLALFGLFLYLLGQVRANNLRNGELVGSLAVRGYAERFGADRAEGGEVLVVVPAYNEAGSIRAVLGSLPKSLCGKRVEVVVVDDGSSDGTEEITAGGGFPVAVHAVNRGQGDALRTGFEIARLRGAEVVVNFDADGQYRAEDLERLVAPILAGEADYVHGSRFMGFYEEAGSVRHLGVLFFSRLVSLLAGQKITDCTNGLRAIRGSELEKFDLREDRFNATELILEALRNGLRLEEVPVSMLKRAAGETKKPPRLRYPFGVLRVIIQTWLR